MTRGYPSSWLYDDAEPIRLPRHLHDRLRAIAHQWEVERFRKEVREATRELREALAASRPKTNQAKKYQVKKKKRP